MLRQRWLIDTCSGEIVVKLVLYTVLQINIALASLRPRQGQADYLQNNWHRKHLEQWGWELWVYAQHQKQG